MRRTSNNHFLKLLFAFLVACTGCVKKSYLTQIPDGSLLALNTADDAQALLDNITIMRESPSLAEVSADNFYLPSDSGLLTMDPVELNTYLWKPDIFEGKPLAGDWVKPYQQVYYANAILAALPALTGPADQLNHIRGAALFIRAYAFYNLAVEFANLYTGTADTDAGIPLHLTPDPLASVTRSTVKETYDRILTDAKTACGLLMQQVDPDRKNRPSQPAAYALLARIYLSMGDFAHAGLYADSCLNSYSTLLDYKNYINAGVPIPFSANNDEVLYQSNLLSTTDVFFRSNCYIDSTLYASFSDSDLRKSLYFSIGSSGLPNPQYSYSGDLTKFSGLAVDEVYLIRAECNAHLGKITEAVQDITTLLKTRWENNAYSHPPVSSQKEALDLVLQERRKELVFRGLRWTDIRRLNSADPSHAITLKRVWFGQTYTLPPFDKRYILPIPPDVIAINGGISQNPRN